MISLVLSCLIFWQMGIASTTALKVVNGSFASSQEFYAVPWSAFIGNFTSADCASIVAPLVYVQLDEIICEPLNSTKYQGRIAFIEEFYGSRNSKFQGCPQETRYHNFVNAGAVGVVSWYNGYPGKYREVFNTGFERNMGKVPLLSIGSDFNEIAAQFIENPDLDVNVQLSCEEDEYWKFWNNVRMVHFTILGSVTFLWGLRGIVTAIQIRRRNKSNGIAMAATILVIEGVILLVVGGSMTLGVVGDSTQSLFGYAHVGAQFRNFMYFGYSGASFWTSILVALYWQEIRLALASFEISSKVHNVFTTMRGLCVIIITFLAFPVTEVVLVYLLAFQFVRIPAPAITGIIALLNAGVSIFFIYQAHSLKKFLNRAARMMTDATSSHGRISAVDSTAANAMTDNARHMARWLQVYAAFNLIQIALVVPFTATVNIKTGPGSTVFLLLVTCTRNGSSIAKIEALIPVVRQKKKVVKSNSITPNEKNHTPLFSSAAAVDAVSGDSEKHS